MRVVRALFWIVAVSLLLAGGNGFSARYADVPGARYVNEDSPAYHSAQRVVASVQQLNGWCAGDNDAQARICATAGKAGHMTLEGIDRLMAIFMSLDIFVADEDTGQFTLKSERQTEADTVVPVSAPISAHVFDEAPVSLIDDLQNLLYNDDEELDDFG